MDALQAAGVVVDAQARAQMVAQLRRAGKIEDFCYGQHSPEEGTEYIPTDRTRAGTGALLDRIQAEYHPGAHLGSAGMSVVVPHGGYR